MLVGHLLTRIYPWLRRTRLLSVLPTVTIYPHQAGLDWSKTKQSRNIDFKLTTLTFSSFELLTYLTVSKSFSKIGHGQINCNVLWMS